MKLIDGREETEAEVTWQDQEHINSFSKLNGRMDSLEEEYAAKKTEKEYLDDLVSELELADDEDEAPYKIGDAFVRLTIPECRNRLERDAKKLDSTLESMRDRMESMRGEMDGLKEKLYAKFGKSINLER